MDPIELSFQFSGVSAHPAQTAEASTSQSFCDNYVWSIQPVGTALVGGVPTYDIEVSNDDINWQKYSVAATGISTADGFDDDHLAWKYMRINHIPGATTGGTVEYKFVGKRP